jgi:hypothetical protein
MLKIKVVLTNGLKWANKFNTGNIKVKQMDLTMGHLMFKIRLMVSGLDSADAVYLFINNQTLVCNSDSLISVFEKHALNGVLNITATKESTFGALSHRFDSATILEISPQAFKLSVTYSYYGLYAYTDVWVYKSQIECVNRLLLERCSGGNLLITKANGEAVKIDPGPG